MSAWKWAGITVLGVIAFIAIMAGLQAIFPSMRGYEKKPVGIKEAQPVQVQRSEADNSYSQAVEGEAKWEGELVRKNVVNPATLMVMVKVKNTGTAAGVPTCRVIANDPSSTYHGFEVFELSQFPGGEQSHTVQPGEDYTFVGRMTIENEGAAYVTDVKVECY